VISEDDGLDLMIAKLSFRKPYNGSTFLPNEEGSPYFSGEKTPKHPSESGQIQLSFAKR
jgi:hypothetical protein